MLRISLLFGLLVCLFAWPLWGLGQCLYPSSNLGDFPLHFDGVTTAKNYDLLDSLAQGYPTHKLVSEELRSGHLPLWNPYNMLGLPVFQGQANYYFYPPLMLAHLVLPVAGVHDLMVCLHLWLACLSMTVFLRGLGLSTWACAWGGLLWGFNGYLSSNLQFESLLICLSWFPLWLFLIQKGRWRSAALVGGVGVGAGPLNIVWMSWAVGALWACFVHRRSGLLASFVSLATSALLSCAQTLPTLHVLRESVRFQADPWMQVANFDRLLVQLGLGFFVPEAFGNPARGFHCQRLAGGQWFFFETCLYLGVAGGLLAIWGLWRARRPQETFWRSLLGLQLLVLATPAFLLLSRLPFAGGVASLRTLPFSAFALVIMAARGFEELSPRLWKAALALALTQMLAVAAWLKYFPSHPWMVRIPFPESGPEVAQAAIGQFFQWGNVCFWGPLVQLGLLSLALRFVPQHRLRPLLVIWTALDLLLFAQRYNPGHDRALLTARSQCLDVLAQESRQQRVLGLGVVRPNLGAIFNIRDLSGYGSLIPARQSFLISGLRSYPPHFEAVPIQLFPLTYAEPTLVSLLNVGALATYPGAPAPKGWSLIDESQVPIYRNPQPLPLVRFAVSVKFCPEGQELSNLSLGHDVITGPPEHEGKGVGTARLLSWEPGRLRAELQGRGWLVVGEGWSRGWRARVDGQSVPLRIANSAQMALWVGPEARLLEMEYWPPGLTLGLTLSGLAWLGLLLQYQVVLYNQAVKSRQKEHT